MGLLSQAQWLPPSLAELQQGAQVSQTCFFCFCACPAPQEFYGRQLRPEVNVERKEAEADTQTENNCLV